MRASLAAALALVLAAQTARADEPSGDPDDLVLLPGLDDLELAEELDRAGELGPALDPQLVRSTSRIAVPLAEAPGIVTILRGADLRAMGARTLADALRFSPELDVTRDSFGYYHVAVRGRRVDAEVLVLLDGHRINDFYDGRILYEVPIATVERIEILRGPGSALYGTNAFAGVISVYTRKRLDRRLELAVTTSGGDRDNTVPSALWLATSGGVPLGAAWRGYGSLEVTRGDGPRLLVAEDSLTRNRMHPETGASQSRSCDNAPEDDCPDSAYSWLPSTALRASLSAERSPGWLVSDDAVRAAAHVAYVDRGPFIGEFDTLTPDSRLRTARLLAGVSYELPLTVDGAMTLSSTSAFDLAAVDREIQVAPDGFNELVEGMAEPFPDGQLKVVDYTELVLRQDLRWKWLSSSRNVLVAGAEVEHARMPHFGFATNYDDAGRRYDQLGNHFDFELDQDGKTRTVLGAYVEDLFSAPGNVQLVAGGRVDLYSDFGVAFSPRAGAVWHAGDLSLKLFYGRAFRAPTFQELYDQTGRIDLGQFVGNPELDASRVQTVEGAALYVRALDRLLLEATLSGAYSAITDSIDRAPISGLANPVLNSSDVSAAALSVDLRASFDRRFSAFANVSWQAATADYEYIDPDRGLAVSTRTPLRNVPGLRANAGVAGQLFGRYRAGLLAEIGDRRRNNQRTPLEAQHFFDYGAYALVDAYAEARELWRGTYARLAVRNLTNRRVYDEPFRANRMPLGIPRDRLRIDASLGIDF